MCGFVGAAGMYTYFKGTTDFWAEVRYGEVWAEDDIEEEED
jgi:hypothetical protein